MAFCCSAVRLAPFLLSSLLAVHFSFAQENADLLENANNETSTQVDLVEKYREKEQKYYESLGRKGGEKCDVYYDPENGKCALWDESSKKYKRPVLPYDITEEDFKCVNAFHSKIFGPSCGDPKFEMVKHCAKVKFYGDTPPENGGINEDNKDLLLMLVDGCLVCLKGESDESLQVTVKLRLIYTLSAGSFFTACDVTTMETEEVTVILEKKDIANKRAVQPKSVVSASDDLSNSDKRVKKPKAAERVAKDDYNEKDELGEEVMCPDKCVRKEDVEEKIDEGQRHFGTFTLPGVLLQRKCRAFFALEEPTGKFLKVQLKVEHNCENERAKTESPMIIPLADTVKLNRFKHNVAEVRGLYINLGANSVSQYQPLLEKGWYRVIKRHKENAYPNAVVFDRKK
ncbi:hypothetical protein niasHT_034479 [Heterodera trifolii]|uniref:Uncharacterized protein n=1 Tax=Heterodera trifolii TaxID=157864 RepID=A0ABD2HQ43_9BILA